MNRTAVIAGASGLVGGLCLEMLLADETYGQVLALGRRRLELSHPKPEQEVVPFDQLAGHPVRRCDVAFCALGTTIRAAGSQAAFRQVDFDYVRDFARWAHAGGTPAFVLVSAVGADPGARNFYLRTKGETEQAIHEIGFREEHIFRPGFLVGPRREPRWNEKIALPILRALSVALVGRLSKYRAIAARDVARAMVRAGAVPHPGTHVYHWRQILGLAGGR